MTQPSQGRAIAAISAFKTSISSVVTPGLRAPRQKTKNYVFLGPSTNDEETYAAMADDFNREAAARRPSRRARISSLHAEA